MIFLLVLSGITGIAGCAITTAWLPANLRWQGAQCAVFTLIIQGCILKVIPLDTDGSGLLIAAGLMLSQWFAPLIAKETRKLRVHFRIPSVPGYLLMYILCLVLIGASWFPIWMVLR
ncbi:hypothetical protein HNS33_21785 [Enterobacter roggenkampii]|uniref:Uncharacterized protein n=1 Tax=Enterobacter roggenkampii TaxID=1812935 RepID=A0A7G8AFP1_9ENTR|nr:hypothetical protein [Enterobacter roggenkampii]MBA2155487.1 hypothetical protein [Enterobacter roggenkampii]QNI18432.1 hypothetical protein [Enterobacter roggenkampii]